MYNPTLVLFFSFYLLYVDCTVPQCCPGENILIVKNITCWDGSNVTAPFCDGISFVGATQVPPTYFQVDDNDGTLIVTSDQNMEYINISPDKYCLTNDSKDNSETAMACIEPQQTVNLSTKGTTLIILKSICAAITVMFLLAILVIYLVIPDLRDMEGNSIVNFTISLCISHLVVIVIPVAKHFRSPRCEIKSFLFFMSDMSAHNWLSVLSFHLWRITIRPVFRPHIRWFLLYCCYGYGVPLIILITALTLYYTQDTSLQQARDFQCWIDGSMIVWGYFFGGTMVISLISITLQFFVAKKLWMGDSKKDQSEFAIHLRNKSLIYLHLLFVVVLAKVADIIAYVYMEKHIYLDYIWQFCDCKNMLLGGVIFFIFVIQRRRALKALAKRGGLGCIKFPEKWKKLVDDENKEEQSRTATLTQNQSSL